jgi:hypothetical protein
MRAGTLLLVSIAFAGVLTGEATAGMPDPPSVAVLRGSSAPPPPAEPAPPNVVVLNQVVYQTVAYPYYAGYFVPSFFGASSFRPPVVAPVAPAPIPNGWPLLGALGPLRR